MAKIVYRKGVTGFRDGDIEPAFVIEGVEDQAVFTTLKEALQKTAGAEQIGDVSDFDGLSVTYENILALEATGFEWDVSAVVCSISTVSSLLQGKRSS